ncbi:bifunctional 4-hydroxy-2-oxoglutarate aldolase/2-dehydro-3-deoxy-phosphogluconate aldolase [Jiulongibacter sp. NS-SX5]|uniref:bifunctional 4-hydroxy-2-oxoglutarate aldolase/2-dehydro-3-deoxy-phosphogluconate aldolase n=1 Tax=Jiulongibacter sp. NS-SX5 TaxID=3463854 RepID=UPI00405850EF
MLSNTLTFTQNFEKAPLVGIIRGYEEETCLKLAESFQEAGLYAMEVTLNTPNALQIGQVIQKQFPSLKIGSGTVLNLKEAQKAIDQGSEFIVTPVLDLEVIRFCKENDIPVFPGAFSPTEIYQAWEAGATAVKIFPATTLGPQYVKDILGPLNQIKLLPTGGVDIDNITSFFSAGAYGVGLGSSLFPKQFIENEDWKGLSHFMKRMLTKALQ